MTRMPKANSKLPADLLERLVPVLLVASIALAFVVGVLWQKVNNLESGGTSTAGTTVGGEQPAGPTQGKLSEDQASKIPPVSDEDHIRGDRNAEITLIEYSDYECPFCERFHPTTQQILDEYEGTVRLVYRHFPLDQLHPKARPAAVASECVAELGGEDAFWAFTDAVFANQLTTLSDLAGTAGGVGVNTSAFQSCFDSGRYADKVESQYQGGLEAGITGTPGNLVLNQNGDVWLIPGALPFESVKAVIDEALSS